MLTHQKKKKKNDFLVFFFLWHLDVYKHKRSRVCFFFFSSFYVRARVFVRIDSSQKTQKEGKTPFFFFATLAFYWVLFFSPFLLSFLLSRSTFLSRKEEVPAKNKHAAVLSSSSYFHPFLYNCVFFSFCFVLLLPVLSLFVVWKCAAIKVYLGFFWLTFRKGGVKKNTQI